MVSRTTLWRRCQALGLISIHSGPRISDIELDAVIQMLVRRFPNCGSVMMWGHLHAYGIIVPRRRVRESLLWVSPRLVELHSSTTIVRRRYNVESSNALWHMDGLHCLIRWRIVIHGGIDGYSRRVVYVRASDNNRASTVFEQFLAATKIYGWPSRVWSDYGGEISKLQEPCCCAGVWAEQATLQVPAFTTSALNGCGVMFSLVLAIYLLQPILRNGGQRFVGPTQ